MKKEETELAFYKLRCMLASISILNNIIFSFAFVFGFIQI